MPLTLYHIFSISPLLITSILLLGQSILNVVFLSSFKIKSYGLLLLCNSQLDSLKNYKWHFSSYVKRIELISGNRIVILCFSSETNNFEKNVFQLQYSYNEQTSIEIFVDPVQYSQEFRIEDLGISTILILPILSLGVIIQLTLTKWK